MNLIENIKDDRKIIKIHKNRLISGPNYHYDTLLLNQ